MIHRTRPEHAAVAGWVPLDDEWEVTVLPCVDRRFVCNDHGDPCFARLTYADALVVADRYGAELPSPEDLRRIAKVGIELVPYLGTPVAETSLHHSKLHDADVWRQLRARGWAEAGADAPVVAGAGKHWVADAPAGRSRLMGWDKDGPGPGEDLWQPDMVAHNRDHHDDGTTTMLKRKRGTVSTGDVEDEGGIVIAEPQPAAVAETDPAPPPSTPGDTGPSGPPERLRTLRKGSRGPLVGFMQRIVGATADEIFGPGTERRVILWQEAQGLVADGVFGRKSWRAAGHEMPVALRSHDPRAPACVAVLRDANAAWPSRSRVSDGIMGDPAHQARKSDHNLGNAVDVTHDPASGCDCNLLAEMAIADERVTYVIWNRRIYNRARAAEGWRDYRGSNGHTHHAHISVRVDRREDDSPWPWSPKKPANS